MGFSRIFPELMCSRLNILLPLDYAYYSGCFSNGHWGLLTLSSMYVWQSYPPGSRDRQPKLENIEGHLSAKCFAEYLHKSSYSFPTVTLWWSRWYPHLQVRTWAQKLNNISSIIAKKWYSWGQTQDLFYLHYAKMIVKNSKVKGVY